MIRSIADLIIVGPMRRVSGPLTAVVVAAAVVSAQELTLETVLARAAAYVADYQMKLQGIVAEEAYSQNVITTGRGGSGRGRINREGRQLKSDVLMVKLGDEERWVQFRDVFEVDRKAVRDRDHRLYKLFVEGKANAREMAQTIQNESARYNIGPVMRNINIPMLAMLFLERGNQPFVIFTQQPAGNVKRFSAVAVLEDIWLIEFKEVGTGTLIKGASNRDIPSRGRFWIEGTTGRILRTELVAQNTDLRASVDVTYRIDPAVAVLVPGEMREVYNVRGSDARIDGRATYTHFRQFTVTTTEKTEKPKQLVR
jgi:hypothetical protein